MPNVEQPGRNFSPEIISGTVCIANISPVERQRRLIFGMLSLVVGLALLLFLLMRGNHRRWRLLLLLPFWSAASGYFQWRDKTCVGLANLDSRKTGDRMEKIEDRDELEQVRWQAKQVQIKSLISAIPLTLIALALPELE